MRDRSHRAPVRIAAPLAGRVVALTEVPDPVFAGDVVGTGLAILPDEPDPGTPERVVVVAPCAGRVASVYPHAVMIQADADRAVLVHLGVETDEMTDGGSSVAARAGDRVEPGQPIMAWSPAGVRSGGRSTLCPVVALGAEDGDLVRLVEPGDEVEEGQVVLLWT